MGHVRYCLDNGQSNNGLTKFISVIEIQNCTTQREVEQLIRKFSFPNVELHQDPWGNITIFYPPEYRVYCNPFTREWPELGKHRCKDGVYR